MAIVLTAYIKDMLLHVIYFPTLRICSNLREFLPVYKTYSLNITSTNVIKIKLHHLRTGNVSFENKTFTYPVIIIKAEREKRNLRCMRGWIPSFSPPTNRFTIAFPET